MTSSAAGLEAASQCRGVAFLFTYKVGVFASASGGSGILIAKKPGTQEWGLPVAIGLGGIGGGLDFGVSRAYQIMVLNTDHAVRNFCQNVCATSIALGVSCAHSRAYAAGHYMDRFRVALNGERYPPFTVHRS
eukprot:357398-Chlamydomonas_euryale.AAC.1